MMGAAKDRAGSPPVSYIPPRIVGEGFDRIAKETP